jgi:hypothetical protein
LLAVLEKSPIEAKFSASNSSVEWRILNSYSMLYHGSTRVRRRKKTDTREILTYGNLLFEGIEHHRACITKN